MANPTLIRQILESAFNRGELDIVDDLVAADSVARSGSRGIPNSRMAIKGLAAVLRTAFPDLECVVGDEISEDDRQAATWKMRGTHRGPYLGNRPTNRPVEIQGFFLVRIENGRIVENWILFEEFQVIQQLGLAPPL